MIETMTPADHAGRAADEAGFAGASLGAVRDEIEAGDFGAAAEAARIAAVAARRAVDHAAAGLRLALQPLEVAKLARVEIKAAREARDEIGARRASLPAGEARETTDRAYEETWRRFVRADRAERDAERGVDALGAVAGLYDGIEAAGRAAASAAEAAELLAVALAPTPGCYGCEFGRAIGKEHAMDCKHNGEA
jgi:hypothetical protein